MRLGTNGVDEIKSHPFFRTVDWKNIRKTKAPFIPAIKNDYDTTYFETLEPKESFYPAKIKNKRKDIEYIGYTYKDSDEEDINFDEEMKKACEKVKEVEVENGINKNTIFNSEQKLKKIKIDNPKRENMTQLYVKPRDNSTNKNSVKKLFNLGIFSKGKDLSPQPKAHKTNLLIKKFKLNKSRDKNKDK